MNYFFCLIQGDENYVKQGCQQSDNKCMEANNFRHAFNLLMNSNTTLQLFFLDYKVTRRASHIRVAYFLKISKIAKRERVYVGIDLVYSNNGLLFLLYVEKILAGVCHCTSIYHSIWWWWQQWFFPVKPRYCHSGHFWVEDSFPSMVQGLPMTNKELFLVLAKRYIDEKKLQLP